MKTLLKWSVEDYHNMIDAGILCDRNVELLAGEIIKMSPESPSHYYTVKQGTKYLETLLTGKADIRFNGPITLSESEPEPDIAIVRLPESIYKDHHPYSEDIFWIIEVAKSSLKKDLELKLSIYAQANIQEYWVLDLSQKQLIVFRDPKNNIYLSQQIIHQGNINPLAFPDIEISVERLLK
ncbi:MAG TPA: Uma2 family endonuclease [Candidatus Obscuribacterales bacterium]